MSQSETSSTKGSWIVDLSQLPDRCPVLTESYGRHLAEAAAVCLEERNHGIRTQLVVSGSSQGEAWIIRDEVDDRMQRTHADTEEATELGACGIAFLLIRETTSYQIIERSRKGTGFDYWLGEEEDDLPFVHAARLEVSGIRAGDEAALRGRVKQKRDQITRSNGSIPGYVAVVLFERPEARVVRI